MSLISQKGRQKSLWDVNDYPIATHFELNPEHIAAQNDHVQRLWEARQRTRVPWLIGSFRWRVLSMAPELFAQEAAIEPAELATLEDPSIPPRTLLRKHAEPLSGVAMYWDGLARPMPETNGEGQEREMLQEGLERLLLSMTLHLRMQTHVMLHRARLLHGADAIDDCLEITPEMHDHYCVDLSRGGKIVPLQTLLQLPFTGSRGWTHPPVQERIRAYVEDIQKAGMRKPHAMLRALLEYCHVAWHVEGMRSAGLPISLIRPLLSNETIDMRWLDVLRNKIPSLPEAGLQEVRACFEEVQKKRPSRSKVQMPCDPVGPSAPEASLDIAALQWEVSVNEPRTIADAIRILASQRSGTEALVRGGSMTIETVEALAAGEAPVPFSVVKAFFAMLKIEVPVLAESQYRLRRADILAAQCTTPIHRAVEAYLENDMEPKLHKKRSKDPAFQYFIAAVRAGESVNSEDLRKQLGIQGLVQEGYLHSLLSGEKPVEAVRRTLWVPGHPQWRERRRRLWELVTPGPSRMHLPSADPGVLADRSDALSQWRNGTFQPEIHEGIDTRLDQHVRALVEILPGATSQEIADALLLPLPLREQEDEGQDAFSPLDGEAGTLGKPRRPALPHLPRTKVARTVHGKFAKQLLRNALRSRFIDDEVPKWLGKSAKFLLLCIRTVFAAQGINAASLRAAKEEARETLNVLIAEHEHTEKQSMSEEEASAESASAESANERGWVVDDVETAEKKIQ